MGAKEQDQTGLVIEVEPTKSSCIGSAAAYLFRTVAARAGSYAPGIEERMFDELERRGGSLPSVEGWFAAYNEHLSYLGYRYMVRRVAFRTDGIINWVAAGEGYRGALLPTDAHVLHPGAVVDNHHAVALVHSPNGASKNGVVMIDPWPETTAVEPPAELDSARRIWKWAALLVFWAGHS